MAPGEVGARSARRRVLITGGAGNVAGWLIRRLPPGTDLHVTVHRSPLIDRVRGTVTPHRVDLRSADDTTRLMDEVAPDVVIHTAYAQGSRAAIVTATGSVAAGAAEVGASLVHLSTDVVFAGDHPPYDETSSPDPIDDYGRWKLGAERAAEAAVPDVCTVRISLAVSLDPPDRVTAALAGALRSGRGVTLFHDEMRQPIRSQDLAAELWALVALERTERAGTWHLPGPEHVSRLQLGSRLAAALGVDPGGIRSASAATHPAPRVRDPRLVGRRRAALGVDLSPFDAW